MRLPRQVTHVIFDMDGVLLDTERLYTEATQQFLARFGKTYDWSLKSHMIGRPAIESARYLVETLGLPITPEEYLVARELVFETLMPTAAAMPGARELVEALAARHVPIGVATSSARPLFALKTMRHREWFARFAVIVTGDDPRVKRGKPAPDIFLVAAQALGAKPSDCVVVEDAPAGVAAAHAAGMQVIAVPDPNLQARERLDRAEVIVGSLAELRPEDLGF